MPQSFQQPFPQARSEELIIEALPDETLIYDLRTNKAHCLNRISSLVWHACDGQRNPVQLQQAVAAKVQAPVSPDLVCLALDELQRAQLLQAAPGAEAGPIDAGLLPARGSALRSSTPTLSRRELLRRAGTLAAAAAVTSIVAPTVAQASTGATAPRGSACTAGRNCSSGVCSNGTCQ